MSVSPTYSMAINEFCVPELNQSGEVTDDTIKSEEGPEWHPCLSWMRPGSRERHGSGAAKE